MHHEQQINKKGGISLSKVLTDNLFAYLLAVLISHRKWQYIIPYKSGIFTRVDMDAFQGIMLSFHGNSSEKPLHNVQILYLFKNISELIAHKGIYT